MVRPGTLEGLRAAAEPPAHPRSFRPSEVLRDFYIGTVRDCMDVIPLHARTRCRLILRAMDVSDPRHASFELHTFSTTLFGGSASKTTATVANATRTATIPAAAAAAVPAKRGSAPTTSAPSSRRDATRVPSKATCRQFHDPRAFFAALETQLDAEGGSLTSSTPPSPASPSPVQTLTPKGTKAEEEEGPQQVPTGGSTVTVAVIVLKGAQDNLLYNLAKHFPLTTYALHRVYVARSLPVVVHCAAGVSRSVSVAVAFLISHLASESTGSSVPPPVDDVLKTIQARRPMANPNASFRKQLEAWRDSVVKGDDKTCGYVPS